MDTQQFLLQIDPASPESCHFELRLDGSERLFHVSIRFDAGRYVMNDMRGGVWGEGVWHDLPDGFDRRAPFLVHRQDARVCVFMAGQTASFQIDRNALHKGQLRAAGDGIGWTYLDAARAARIDASDGEARLTAVPVARTLLALPAGVSPAVALQLAADVVLHEPGYLRFLAAAALPAGTPVLDLGSPALGLAHALLCPQRAVRLVGDDTASLEAIVAANKLENVTFLTPEALDGAQLHEHDGALVQGRRVRERLGQTLRTAGAIVYDIDQPEPLPDTVLLAAPDTKPGTKPDSKPGLDIVVALFNTRDHVVQCVQSLLCDGRDDIGVIVVDDGSTDESGDLVRDAFATDSRVRIVRKANGGCASARNYGRLCSDSTHLAFVDADDWVDQGFFSGLYELALQSGAEMVQGGFDFFDETRDPPRAPYGGDLALADIPLEAVGSQQARHVPSERLLRGQPTIWRKVYRRDFLNSHKIWFPESIRAYDDYLFHLLTLTYAPKSWMLPGPKYLYRQHQAQDIRQGDARHFNMLAMFSMIAQRARDEDWPDFAPYAQTMTDAIQWSSERLRPELVSAFLQAGAQVCVSVARCWGPEAMGDDQLATITHPDFRFYLDAAQAGAAPFPDGRWWATTEATFPHPDTVRMHLSLKRSL